MLFINIKVSNLIDTMKGMGPAAIDLEFQLLVSENDKDITSLSVLIDFLLEGLQSRNNFELIQSYIGLVLKVSILMVNYWYISVYYWYFL